ncbi:MAG: hypothetical protein JJE04_10830 [Acidobacteriia bacterium]|nr:hypothetical protein [Terriglobia bacterium]
MKDEWLLRPVYPHQRFLLHEDGFKQLKVHVPTAGGKTLGALLFALRDTFKAPSTKVRAIFSYPTNLLSRDQFERSIVRGLREWVGAKAVAEGVIDPVSRAFVRDDSSFEQIVGRGAPTYVFSLPPHLGGRDLYVTVITGEALQHLLSMENIVELGRRKGTYLLQVLVVLNQHDHIIVCSPDLLGYVAQRCYSVSANFYNRRWRDELELKLGDHQIVIDEYHFYDPYTYLNLAGAIDRLGSRQSLCLSATGNAKFFSNAEVLGPAELSDSGEMNVASQPIDISIHQGEMPEPHTSGNGRCIWFYHSAISAHESAESLRHRGLRITEWTGIRKSRDDAAQITVATSAAEVGLDLPFRTCHTEFWGNAWEVPSLIQRIGRVGRSEEAGRSEAHLWVTGREPKLLGNLFDGCASLSKTEFAERLRDAFGEESFRPDDYVSSYLWDEAKTKELRRFWQLPPNAARLRFHFRPPNSQAIFNWAGTRFSYDWIPIANRYELEKVSDVTDLPFWHEMGYSEFRVVKPLEKRAYRQRYEGKKDKEHRRWFYDE